MNADAAGRPRQHADRESDLSARRASRTRRRLLAGAIAVFAIAAGSFAAYRSSQSEKTTGLDAIAPATTAPPVAPTTPPTSAPASSTTVATTPTTLPPTTTPRSTSIPVATGVWLVASERGIERVTSDGTVTKLLDGPAATVAVASDATIYFQRRAPHATFGQQITAADTAILAFDRRTGTIRTVVTPDPRDGPGAVLELDGVASIDGRTQLLVRRWRADDSKPYEERAWIELVRIDPSSGATSSPVTVGIWEMGSTEFSYGGGLLVATFAGEGSLWPAVFATDGTRHTGIGPLQGPHSCGFASAHCPNSLAISPDGHRLAWIESPVDTFNGNETPREVVVADVASRNELARVAVGEGMAVTRLQFNGADEVIITRRFYATTREGPATLASTVSGTINVREGTFTRLAVDGTATADTLR